MQRRRFLTVASVLTVSVLASACTVSQGTGASAADQRHSIDANTDTAMNKLYQSVPISRDLVRRSSGVLVFPDVLNAGLFVGGQYGKGVLRANGEARRYYEIAGGSFGLQAGAQSKAIIILFMTPQALSSFEASKGWTAGVDGSVAVAQVGVNGSVDTATTNQPVIAFVVTNAGLMANLSLAGTKISPLLL